MEGKVRGFIKGVWDFLYNIINVDRVTIVIIPLVVCYASYISFIQKEPEKLQVISSLVNIDKEFSSLQGRILKNGNPVAQARVWIIINDGSDNEYSPPAHQTNKNGEFRIDSIPHNFVMPDSVPSVNTSDNTTPDAGSAPRPGISAGSKIKEVKVFAFLSTGEDKDTGITGSKVILIKGDKTSAYQRRMEVNIRQIIFLPIIFLTSILLPFVRVSPRVKYNFSLILAFLFTVAIIVTISRSISLLSSSDNTEVLSFGFAHIFWGSYSPGTQAEWLFSLTSPHTAGFGAPLWVLLLSVIGSSLFTVLILVSEIKSRPKFVALGPSLETCTDQDAKKKFNETIENIVRHQFYMLFSPLSAIFVYQVMVMAEAASHPFTVAIAALGAGSTLNIILDKAVLASKKAIGKTKSEEDKIEIA